MEINTNCYLYFIFYAQLIKNGIDFVKMRVKGKVRAGVADHIKYN